MPCSGRVSIFPCHCTETPDEVGPSRIEALHDDEVDVKAGHRIRKRADCRESLFVAVHPLEGDVDVGDLGEAFGMDEGSPLVNAQGPVLRGNLRKLSGRHPACRLQPPAKSLSPPLAPADNPARGGGSIDSHIPSQVNAVSSIPTVNLCQGFFRATGSNGSRADLEREGTREAPQTHPGNRESESSCSGQNRSVVTAERPPPGLGAMPKEVRRSSGGLRHPSDTMRALN